MFLFTALFIKQKDLALQPSADFALGLVGQDWTSLEAKKPLEMLVWHFVCTMGTRCCQPGGKEQG